LKFEDELITGGGEDNSVLITGGEDNDVDDDDVDCGVGETTAMLFVIRTRHFSLFSST
jgi:hypothetical protein